MNQAQLRFIEDVGLALQSAGLLRMAGRVLGMLLLADAPEQSALYVLWLRGAAPFEHRATYRFGDCIAGHAIDRNVFCQCTG